MKAVYKNNNNVAYLDIAKPVIKNTDDVIIRVKLAAICRTDIYVANGTIDCKDQLVLGHEFSGIVADIGSNVDNVSIGNRVTVMPVMPCGKCDFCTSGKQNTCPNTTMLGIDKDGAFAEYVSVPASLVYELPNNVSFKLGAYSEPVAASLSILKSGINKNEKGLIYGNNRFADLIYRILKAENFNNIDVYNPDIGKTLLENHYDFAIETFADKDVIQQIFAALKPKGKLVLKSRKYDPVGICFQQVVMKELTLTGVNYGSFKDVLNLLANEDFNVDDLLGEIFPLAEFESVFEYANQNEGQKLFFEMG